MDINLYHIWHTKTEDNRSNYKKVYYRKLDNPKYETARVFEVPRHLGG